MVGASYASGTIGRWLVPTFAPLPCKHLVSCSMHQHPAPVGNPPSMIEPQTASEHGQSRDRGIRPAHVGVVVLNWRRPREIVACIASVEAQDYRYYRSPEI